MTKIDEVVERECNHVGYTSKCYSPRELRALLQEVHDAAVAECGKDAERYRIVKDEIIDYKPAGYDGCNFGRWDTMCKSDEKDFDVFVDSFAEKIKRLDAAIAAAKVE